MKLQRVEYRDNTAGMLRSHLRTLGQELSESRALQTWENEGGRIQPVPQRADEARWDGRDKIY